MEKLTEKNKRANSLQMSYSYRRANLNDVIFLSKVIMEAEKSGSDKIGLATIFNLSEAELQNYLIQILEEEIEGCEWSVSSYFIAECDKSPVAAFAGWNEKENEDEQPSSILKSNLIGFVFPKEKLVEFQKNQKVIKGILIEREPHTHQLEYAYVDKKHRGNGLTCKIIEQLLYVAKEQNPNLRKSQVQVFENNQSAIKVYERSGYKITKRQVSSHTEILNYLPWNVKLLMEKIL